MALLRVESANLVRVVGMNVSKINAVVGSDMLWLALVVGVDVDGELLMELLLIVWTQLIDMDVIVVGTIRWHSR